MTKNKGAAVAREFVEIDYDVIRPSGYVLRGTSTYPAGESSHGPCVVFLHGTMSNRNHNFVPELCNKLIKDHGIRSFRYDSRFDKSEHEPEHRYKFSGYADDLDDLECVIRHLKKNNFIPFCLFGHSRGANGALLYASSRLLKDPNSDSPSSDEEYLASLDPTKLCCVVASPRFNMPMMLTTLFTQEQIDTLHSEGQFPWPNDKADLVVTKTDADVVCKEMDMGRSVMLIPEQVPILLFHGTDDELIPVDDAGCYKAARESINVQIVDGARHAFRGKKQLKHLLTSATEFIGNSHKEIFCNEKTM